MRTGDLAARLDSFFHLERYESDDFEAIISFSYEAGIPIERFARPEFLTRFNGLMLENSDEVTRVFTLVFPSEAVLLEVERLAVGADFNPEIGYLRRDDIVRSYVQARFSPRLPSVQAIRKLSWDASVDYFANRRGGIENRDVQGQFQIEFENGDEFQVDVTDAFERLDEAFEPVEK